MRQLSSEWFSARSAKVTASRIVDVLDFRKDGKEGAKRAAYRAQLVAETLTGMPSLGGFLSPEMQRGNDFEEMARSDYELHSQCMVDQCGFIVHPTIERSGASPDGLIGKDGCLELKNPKTETHLRWLRAGVVPEEHEPQMMWQLACTGRQWNDFESFDDRLPQWCKRFIVRLERNDERIIVLEDAVERFLFEVDEEIEAIRTLCSAPTLKQQLQASVDAESATMESVMDIIEATDKRIGNDFM